MTQYSLIFSGSSLPDRIMERPIEDSANISPLEYHHTGLEYLEYRICMGLCAKYYPGKSIKGEEPIIHRLTSLFSILSYKIRLSWIRSPVP